MTITLDRPAGYALGVTDDRPGALYGRISKRKKGDGAGAHVKIDDQHAQSADTLTMAYGPIELVPFRDNMSAWDEDVWREDWERMLVEIADGKYRAVAALNGDRFTRQPIQIEKLWAACKRGRAALFVVTQGHIIDPTMLRIEGALAARESDIKSKRATDHHARLAKAGKPSGGGRRFGWTDPSMTKLEPVEADAIREIASMLLSGTSLAACARWLNAQELYGPRGAKWTGPNLRHLILRPGLAALRVQTNAATGERAVVGEAAWPKIIDVDIHEALKIKLGDPDRKVSYSNARVHLLSGLAKCGVCEGRIRSRGAQHAYTCDAQSCVSRAIVHTDERVTDAVVALLARMDVRGLLVDDSTSVELADLTTKRAAIPGRKEAVRDRWADGEITTADKDGELAALDKADAKWRARVAELSEVTAAPQRALAGLTGPDPEVAFAELELGRQRAVIDLLVTVHIDKATHKGARFDPESVRVEPKLVQP